MNSDNVRKFLEFVLSSNVLSFGKFKTKAGRDSPYFFNTGKFSNGKLLATLADFYAKKIINIIEDDNLKLTACTAQLTREYHLLVPLLSL